ncbi:MAG TPA: hypothetical protein K8V06_05405 [Ligilactobacillus salivarius]|uniref:Uncharacterized protein n=1 Tax=Ligilactobacillus salivarius TaxID=1624 RepID=A0A921LKF9_9LACO|nr:hypothetical protein [Ligilactobacillus salivarius]
MSNKSKINEISRLKSQLSLLDGNKLNSEESTIFFAGFFYSLILNKTIFKNNKDIIEFLNSNYIEPLKLPPFKQYLYKSRTLLGSRVSRYILEKISYSNLIELRKLTMIYLDSQLDGHQEKRKKKKSNLINELSGWLNNDN